MAYKPHCLLLRDAGACESRYDRHSCAVEGKMGKTYTPKETVPVARSLCWHVVRCLLALLFQFREKGFQSRNKRSCVATPSFDRERDFIGSCVDIFQRKTRLGKAATLPNGDFKGGAHPSGLRFELVPYQRFFLRRDLFFIFRSVRSYAELRARIYRCEFPGDRFEHNDAPDADVEQCTVKTHRPKSRVFGRMLAPLQILNDVLSFQLARSVHLLGLKKSAYCIPSFPVFCESVRLSGVVGFQKRDNPPIKVFRIGNAAGIGLFLSSLRFELASLSGFRTNADSIASGLIPDFSTGIAKLYPPIRRALTPVNRSHRCNQVSPVSPILSIFT